jgi:hypothetical protein
MVWRKSLRPEQEEKGIVVLQETIKELTSEFKLFSYRLLVLDAPVRSATLQVPSNC